MVGRGIVSAEFCCNTLWGSTLTSGGASFMNFMHKQTPVGGVLRLVHLVRPHRPVPLLVPERCQEIVPVGPLIEAVEFADEDRHALKNFLRGIVHLAIKVCPVSGDVFDTGDISQTVNSDP